MAVIDIRTKQHEHIHEIVFEDDGGEFDYFTATKLTHLDHAYIKIVDDDQDSLVIKKSSISNLIKALQKAQEIWKED